MNRSLLLFALSLPAATRAADTEWGRVRAYFTAGVVFSQEDARLSKETPFVAFNLDKNWHSGTVVHLNSFFETRLTSIPVNGQEASFPSSQKAAHVGGGFYSPLLTTRWDFAGQSHALFVAPLAVAGFDTPTSARVDRFYNRVGAGVRLGHFRVPSETGKAPELLSWLDVVYGRFTSLDPHCKRLSIDGTLKAPGTPLVVGFSANIGRSGGVRDDLRLFLGTRFDLGALMAKLRQLP